MVTQEGETVHSLLRSSEIELFKFEELYFGDRLQMECCLAIILGRDCTVTLGT